MAQAIGNNKPNSYRLISVVISNNEGNQIDVSNLVDSFELTESIYQMFLTGSMTIIDNINIFNRINITGQEYVRLHFSGVQGNEEEVPDDEQINQVFRIFNVSNYGSDTSENLSNVIYKLDFCSPLLYLARTKRISQAYRGKTGDILHKICFDKLNFQEKPKKKKQKKLRLRLQLLQLRLQIRLRRPSRRQQQRRRQRHRRR